MTATITRASAHWNPRAMAFSGFRRTLHRSVALLRLRDVLLSVLVLGAGGISATAEAQSGRAEPWRLIQPPQSSLVYAADGSLVGETGREWRTSISIRSLPRYVAQAFVAIEDHRFYEHDGVDVVGVLGALRDNIRGERRGASTITQQLVGNMHPEIIDRREVSIDRKLREQSAAREMERRYTKEQILEAYLNQIHFGRGWYGVEAASRHYFGKSASRLTLAEAATLAAVPNGPAIYDPIRYPDRTRQRRNLVLSRMAELGYISRALATVTQREPLIVASNAGMSAPAEYFTDAVRTAAERAGVPVFNGGFRVYTTLDPDLQNAAQEALLQGTAAVESRRGYGHQTFESRTRGSTDYLQGAVISMDPLTGNVLALVGGRDHAEAPFNRAVNARRQPGSAFKPFVYAAALLSGVPASALVPDTVLAIPLPNGTMYSPRNADNEYMGSMTIREALVRSRNPVAVQLGQGVGIDSVIGVARRLGIASPIAPVPSSAIGASEVSPLELVAAYTAFANLGVAVQPRLVTRIEDAGGNVVWSSRPEPGSLAVDPRVAFLVRDMLREAVERGTAQSVRAILPLHIPAAGKTGTTNDNTDVWFVGMTPDVVTGVWLGFDTPKPIQRGAGGGALAAPIWATMMARYYAEREPGQWGEPGGLILAELDRDTGRPAGNLTPWDRRYTEYFIPGTEPADLRFNPWRLFELGPVIGL